MAITKLTDSSIVTGDKYSTFAAENYYFEPIYSTLLASSSTSVTFNAIPQTYKHLHIRIAARVNVTGTIGNDNVEMRLNGDTGNYSTHYIYTNGATVSGGGPFTSETTILAGKPANNSCSSGTFGVVILDIADYNNTNKFKVTKSLSTIQNPGSGYGNWYSSGMWASLSPITSIEFRYGGNSYSTDSRFSLYGVKG